MFNIRKLFILLSAVMLALLTSCEFGSLEKRQETGSAVFDFSAVTSRLASASRTVTDLKEFVYEEVDTFADLKLEGDFEYSQKINLKETQTLKIDNIPVGSKITASIEIYMEIMMEDEGRNFKETMWHGTSDQYEIKDGPNEIIIPLIRGGVEEIIDEPEEDSITIWVTYDAQKQIPNTDQEITAWAFAYGNSNPEEEAGRDGKTEETAFHFINSAIKWIAANGNSNEDYKIVLTGYDSQNAFNQGVSIGEEVKGHAKSITITSSDSEHVAIRSTSYPVFYMMHQFNSYPGPVPVIFENIQIASAATGSQNTSTLIIQTDTNGKCDVTLGKNAVFLREEGSTTLGSAITVGYGSTIKMEENARIYNFEAKQGAAVYALRNSQITMNGHSNIDFCKASWYGGAIYCGESGENVILNEDASITNCSAESGGAIYLKTGSVTMNSGTISECGATNYGGAIYLSTEASSTYGYIYGGTISSNTAGMNGGAIYVKAEDSQTHTISYLKMHGNICIDPGTEYSNDIYNAGATLELDDNLTTENPVAALLTYSTLESTYPIITSSDDDIIKNSYSKIKVRVAGSPEIYDLTEEGKPDMP